MYKKYTKTYIDDLFTNIFKEFDKEDESIIKLFANNRRLSETFECDIQSAVRLKILIPVVKNYLSTLMKNVLDQFKSNTDLTQGIAFNEILVNAQNSLLFIMKIDVILQLPHSQFIVLNLT